MGWSDSYSMIKKQVKYLKSQGYPFGNGLYENNLIFRKHNHCSSVTVSEAWWKMYMTYSKGSIEPLLCTLG